MTGGGTGGAIIRTWREYTLCRERAMEVLSYDPETGELRWRYSRPGVRAGSIAGTVNGNGYRQITIDRVTYPAHRIAWLIHFGYWPEQIDHINRVRTDNRIANIRVCDHLGNQQNKGFFANNTSGFKGVSFDRERGRWRCSVQKAKRRVILYGFDTAEEANEACIWLRENFEAAFSGRRALPLAINDNRTPPPGLHKPDDCGGFEGHPASVVARASGDRGHTSALKDGNAGSAGAGAWVAACKRLGRFLHRFHGLVFS